MKESHQRTLARRAIKDIIPDEEYSQKKLIEDEVIPWVSDVRQLRRIPEDVLPRETELGETYWANRITFKGSDIINYIKNYSGLK